MKLTLPVISHGDGAQDGENNRKYAFQLNYYLAFCHS